MKKEIESAWIIIQHSLAGAALEFPPTPGFETTKEIPLAANEIGMCIRIAKVYSGIEFSKNRKYKRREACGNIKISRLGVAQYQK